MPNQIAVWGYARRNAIAARGYVRLAPPVPPPAPPAPPRSRAGTRRPPAPQIVESAGSFSFTVVLVVWRPGRLTRVAAPRVVMRTAPHRIIIPPPEIIIARDARTPILTPDLALITPPKRAQLPPSRVLLSAPRTGLYAHDVRTAVVGPRRVRPATVVVVDADTWAWIADA